MAETAEYMDDDAVDVRLYEALSNAEKLVLEAGTLCRGRPRLAGLSGLIEQIDSDISVALDSLGA